MFSRDELKRLAERKALLQARIDVRRWECAAAAGELARPAAVIDRGAAVWERIAPFVKTLGIPLLLMLTRVAARKRRGKPTGKSKFAAFMTALPIVLRTINSVREAYAPFRARARISGR